MELGRGEGLRGRGSRKFTLFLKDSEQSEPFCLCLKHHYFQSLLCAPRTLLSKRTDKLICRGRFAPKKLWQCGRGYKMDFNRWRVNRGGGGGLVIVEGLFKETF